MGCFSNDDDNDYYLYTNYIPITNFSLTTICDVNASEDWF